MIVAGGEHEGFLGQSLEQGFLGEKADGEVGDAMLRQHESGEFHVVDPTHEVGEGGADGGPGSKPIDVGEDDAEVGAIQLLIVGGIVA
jgi:hypothetical protein